jgi:O-antigen/teichoic acid export membrane protein
LQVVFGWTKSFPTTIGRPRLRIVTHGIEAAVLVPLVAILGVSYGVTGAAVAMLIGTICFVSAWLVVLVRFRNERHAGRAAQST